MIKQQRRYEKTNVFLRKRTLSYITQQLSCAATWISLNIDAHNTHVSNKITKIFFDLFLDNKNEKKTRKFASAYC